MIRRLAILCALASPAAAQDVASAAAEAAAMLEAAEDALAAADGARDRVAALTGVIRGYEDGLIAMRAGLRQASGQRTVLEVDLNSKSDEIGALLGVLQIMGRTPAPVTLLHPGGAVGTARAGMIVGDVTPALQADVTALRADLNTLADLTDIQGTATRTLEEGLRGAQDARAALSTAIQNREPLPTRFVEDPIQTALLLASTQTLDAFAKGLASSLNGGLPNDATLAAKGALALPVQGRILQNYNEPDAAGVERPGWVLATPPRALVLSPTPATILFRGPLLDYGNVVILEPTADVMFVIAGLAEVYGDVGQIIPAGEPLGLLGGGLPETDANLTINSDAEGSAASQTLYLEVRDGQTPVDPATWFALEQQVEEQ